jgi:hypothetical protein
MIKTSKLLLCASTVVIHLWRHVVAGNHVASLVDIYWRVLMTTGYGGSRTHFEVTLASIKAVLIKQLPPVPSLGLANVFERFDAGPHQAMIKLIIERELMPHCRGSSRCVLTVQMVFAPGVADLAKNMALMGKYMLFSLPVPPFQVHSGSDQDDHHRHDIHDNCHRHDIHDNCHRHDIHDNCHRHDDHDDCHKQDIRDDYNRHDGHDGNKFIALTAAMTYRHQISAILCNDLMDAYFVNRSLLALHSVHDFYGQLLADWGLSTQSKHQAALVRIQALEKRRWRNMLLQYWSGFPARTFRHGCEHSSDLLDESMLLRIRADCHPLHLRLPRDFGKCAAHYEQKASIFPFVAEDLRASPRKFADTLESILKLADNEHDVLVYEGLYLSTLLANYEIGLVVSGHHDSLPYHLNMERAHAAFRGLWTEALACVRDDVLFFKRIKVPVGLLQSSLTIVSHVDYFSTVTVSTSMGMSGKATILPDVGDSHHLIVTLNSRTYSAGHISAFVKALERRIVGAERVHVPLLISDLVRLLERLEPT